MVWKGVGGSMKPSCLLLKHLVQCAQKLGQYLWSHKTLEGEVALVAGQTLPATPESYIQVARERLLCSIVTSHDLVVKHLPKCGNSPGYQLNLKGMPVKPFEAAIHIINRPASPL